MNPRVIRAWAVYRCIDAFYVYLGCPLPEEGPDGHLLSKIYFCCPDPVGNSFVFHVDLKYGWLQSRKIAVRHRFRFDLVAPHAMQCRNAFVSDEQLCEAPSPNKEVKCINVEVNCSHDGTIRPDTRLTSYAPHKGHFLGPPAMTRNHSGTNPGPPGTIPEPTRNQPGTNPARWFRVGSGMVPGHGRRARDSGPFVALSSLTGP